MVYSMTTRMFFYEIDNDILYHKAVVVIDNDINTPMTMRTFLCGIDKVYSIKIKMVLWNRQWYTPSQ